MSLSVQSLKLLNHLSLSFTLQSQQCLILKGASGTGKSLCLRALADLDPHQGHIVLDEQDQSQTLPTLWRQKVQWVSAEPQWWEHLVKEHFNLSPSDDVLRQLGLAPSILQEKVAEASVGQRQRLALLRSLAVNPQVLCLDEITANLDLENTVKVERFLLNWLLEPSQNSSLLPRYIVWVSHDEHQIERLQTQFSSPIQIIDLDKDLSYA